MNLIGISGKAQSGKDTVGKMLQYLIWSDLYQSEYNGDLEQLFKQDKLKFYDEKTNTYMFDLTACSGYEIKKFAQKVKEIASILTGIDVEEFDNEKFKRKYLPLEWQKDDDPYQERTYRWLLQTIGTEAVRNTIHPDAWVNALFVDFNEQSIFINGFVHNPASKWIITDVRFPNETKAIIEHKGILIRIERDRYRCSNCSSLVLGNPKCHHCGSDQLMIEPYSEHVSETALDNFKEWNYKISNNGSMLDLFDKVKEIYKKIKND